MTLEDAIATAVASAIGPLAVEVRRLREEVERLRVAMPAPVVTVAEAARLLKVSASTVRRMVRSGEIRSIRVGRGVRVDLVGLRPRSNDEVADFTRKRRARERSALAAEE